MVSQSFRKTARKYLKEGISRREFIRRMGIAGLSLPLANVMLARVAAQEEMSAAARAAQTARERFEGETLNIVWEAGLQAQDPIVFSGPLWEEATGVSINVIEVPAGTELFSRQLNEHIAGSGAFDVLSVHPSWIPDYALAGVTLPLDDLIAEFGDPADPEDLTPIYRGLGTFDGVTHGLFDDGDTLLLYYRTDLFAEHADAFADEYGYELAPPTNWLEFDQIAKFFTDRLAPDIYGAAFGRSANWNWQVLIPHFKANGGEFFDPDTMEPLITGEAGVRTLAEMAHSNRFMPPGIETLGGGETFNEWLAGRYAMTYFWPPLGRWSAGYGQQAEQLSFLPESQVAGNTGYALLPGDISQMAVGFNLAVAAGSPNPELAYLFVQWMNSPEISLQRVTLPYALRDPFRVSHFESDEYSALWDNADQYLGALLEAGEKASLDLIIPGAQEYHDALDRAATSVYAGVSPEDALATAAQEFDSTTDRLGREQQQAAYGNYLAMEGAYPSTNLVDAPSNLDMEE